MYTHDGGRPTSICELFRFIRADRSANGMDPKMGILLAAFRIAQFCADEGGSERHLGGRLVVVLYRALSEFVFGVELRPRTSVGAGLAIFHGVGLVVHDHCVIGPSVVLRNGVTIGERRCGEGVPRLEAGAVIGANAVLLGPITIGRGAVVGAGAVVTKDVEAGQVVVGNPARPLSN